MRKRDQKLKGRRLWIHLPNILNIKLNTIAKSSDLTKQEVIHGALEHIWKLYEKELEAETTVEGNAAGKTSLPDTMEVPSEPDDDDLDFDSGVPELDKLHNKKTSNADEVRAIDGSATTESTTLPKKPRRKRKPKDVPGVLQQAENSGNGSVE